MSSAGAQIFAEISENYGAGAIDDPYPTLARRRRETPVMNGDIMLEFGVPSVTVHYDGPAFTLFRYDDVTAALRDSATFSSSIWQGLFEPLLGRTMLGMDGDEHHHWRGLLMPVFTRQALREWDETILRPIAQQYVAELAQSRRADLVDFAFRFPLRAIYEIIGFTDDLDGYEEFQASALSILLALSVDPTDLEKTQRNVARAVQASQELYAGVLPVVQRKRAEGANRNDLISHLINAEFGGGKLDDHEITTFVRSLLPAATENTTRQFLNTFTSLLRRPDQLERVNADRELLVPALVEGERFESPPLVLPRVTTREVEVRGTEIPANAAIVLAIGAANRDEEAYGADADEYRVDRQGPHPLAFSFGPHICPGMNTARLEIRAMVAALLDGLPGIRFDPELAEPEIRGVTFRGPAALNVVWD